MNYNKEALCSFFLVFLLNITLIDTSHSMRKEDEKAERPPKNVKIGTESPARKRPKIGNTSVVTDTKNEKIQKENPLDQVRRKVQVKIPGNKLPYKKISFITGTPLYNEENDAWYIPHNASSGTTTLHVRQGVVIGHEEKKNPIVENKAASISSKFLELLKGFIGK